MSWTPFEFGATDLLTLDNQVGEGSGQVFSTQPRIAFGTDGIQYFVKGPELETVFAEIGGCVMTNAVSLPVPCVGVCKFAGDCFAGTRKISDLRVIEPFLRRPEKVEGFESIFEAIAVDTWLANNDRNMGNVVAFPVKSSRVRFVFIILKSL